MFNFDYNPIQMGSDFTSFHMSELEIEIRSMVDELYFHYRDKPISIEYIDYQLEQRGLDYFDLPQSCKDMIDELDII